MHGIQVNELATGARPVLAAATAVIGMVATATDADAAIFPLNTPVLVTNINAAIAAAGTQGTLARSLELIADQCSPVLVVVRVVAGADAAATEAAVVGDAGAYSGVHALLAAESTFGVRPRIFGCPGLDTQAVTTALVAVAKKLRGSVYASCAEAETVGEAVSYRGEFGDRELMLIYPNFSGGFAGAAVAVALGTRARLDEEIGWHKTISNVAVAGVTGLSLPIFFDMRDSSNDAGVLNAAPVTTLIRMNGYRFWGNRTCSDDEQFAFESAVRTSHALQDEVAAGVRWAMDRPVHPSLLRDMLETINGRFRSLVSQGRIIGAEAWFDSSKNSSIDLSAGIVNIDFDYTFAAPLENLVLNMTATDRYYGGVAAQI